MRILAFTSDASLEVALASLDETFEVVAARDPEGALQEACRSDLALVALGTTERGLHAAETLLKLRVGIPCLIVGDTPGPEAAETPVLTRPFSLPELAEAMERVARVRPTIPPPPLAEAPPPPPPEPAPEPDPAPEPSEPAPPREPEPEPPSQPEPRLGVDGPDADVDDLLRQLEAAASAVPQDAAAPSGDPISWALDALHEIGATKADQPRSVPPAAAPQPEATAARLIRHAASAPAPGDWLVDQPARRSGLHRLRRRRRTISVATSTRGSIIRRVRSALEGARELESLLVELPMLTQPGAMASALIREVVDLFGCDTAALLALDPDGFRVAASHGLSAVEQAIVAPKDQPLLADVSARMEAVLVAPVDLVRGLVTGVPGTTAEALMLAPLEVDGVCVGVLLSGRSRFADEDLERLWHLAEEAAPGFAASRVIERLRRADMPIAL